MTELTEFEEKLVEFINWASEAGEAFYIYEDPIRAVKRYTSEIEDNY